MKIRKTTLTLVLLALSGGLTLAAPMGTAFTYQGQLFDGTNAANGLYDLNFTLHDAFAGGSVVAGPVTSSDVNIANGLFTTTLDFGAAAFNGDARWLQIAARTNGAASFSTFIPRQAITATPYALDAANATSFGGQLPSYYAPASGSTAYVAKSGDTMTGPLSSTYYNFNGNPPLPGTTTGTLFEQADVGPTVSGLGFEIRTGNPPYWNFGSRLRIDATGNVGIGTTNPSDKLVVNGRLGVFSTGLDGSINQRFVLYADTNNGVLFDAPKDGAGNRLPYQFKWRGDEPGAMTILGSGNVGIGTVSPLETLHVSSSNLAETRLTSTAASGGDWGWGTGWWGSGSARNLYFYDYVSDAARLVIGTDGNVGIGETAPAAKLDVNGSVRASGVINAVGGLIIENRTSDPPSPAPGQIWLRTDL